MDNLTIAFDRAIQNLNVFLDSSMASMNSQSQMNHLGWNTVLVDYLNLLEACCISHPVLKTKISVITQKILSLQNNSNIPMQNMPMIASFPLPPPPPLNMPPGMGSMLPNNQPITLLCYPPPNIGQNMNQQQPNLDGNLRWTERQPPYRMGMPNSNYCPTSDYYHVTPPSLSTPSPPSIQDMCVKEKRNDVMPTSLHSM